MLMTANLGDTNGLLTGLFRGLAADRLAPQAARSEGAARPRRTPRRGRPMQAPFSNAGRHTK